MTEEWLSERIQEFENLTGATVTVWEGVEMAVRDATDHLPPQFGLPEQVPGVQLLILNCRLSDRTGVTVDTYQDDLSWGLIAQSGRSQLDVPEPGIFRTRSLPELPVGRVQEVTVFLDHELMAEVVLTIDSARLLLMAGEVDPECHNTLSWHRLDESVLAFTDPGAADLLPWQPARQGLVRAS